MMQVGQTGCIEHGLKFSLVHIFMVSDLIGIGSDGDIGSQEEDVVDCIRFAISSVHRLPQSRDLPSCSPHIPSEGAR